jgi:Glycosyl transferases group 1
LPNSPLETTASKLLAFATQGAGSDDEARLRALLGTLPATFFPFDRTSKRRTFLSLLRTIREDRPDLVVMEGTGWAGGLACLLTGTRYVVSTGDAVGPFVAAHVPLLGPVFGLYERWLYRRSSGVIGWSPYLVGRALTFGAPRAMTAPGWAPNPLPLKDRAQARAEVRDRLGIPGDALVFGIVGSLARIRQARYSYGLELAQALARVERPDAYALIVGDGNGKARLDALAKAIPGGRCVLTGRVAREDVPRYLAALDVASLPQSLDGVGLFRYTTKLAEYLAAGLPVVTGRLPFAYDLDGGWLWRLPGKAPWDDRYVQALADLINSLGPEELAARREAVPANPPEFDRERQIARISTFIRELM